MQRFLLCFVLSFLSVYGLKIQIHYPLPPSSTGFITLRGNGGGLSWNSGQKAEQIHPFLYVYEIPEFQGSFEFKPLLNDKIWSKGANYPVLENTELLDIYPFFYQTKGHCLELPPLYSPQLKNWRPLMLYLPPSYSENTLKEYPVLYAQDGQNLFRSETSFNGIEWQMDETLDRLILNGEVQEMVVVGIYHSSERLGEYTPSADPEYEGSGKGLLYLDFLEETLIPFLQERYRLSRKREDRFLLGSSLGALISFYGAWTRPHLFSGAFCFSGSFWWDPSRFIPQLAQSSLNSGGLPAFFYLDCGISQDGRSSTQKLVNFLQETQKAKQGVDFYFHLDPQGVHHESSWATRLPYALSVVFSIRSPR
jgi:predicted alpha/beta superfamily hydrolase